MKVAKIVVEEINNTDRLHSAFEMGMRLIDSKLEVEKRKTFGFGCGHHCDAWGIFCGSTCLQGLNLTDDIIQARFAIDVLGKKEITAQDMDEISKDFKKFHESTMEELKGKLSLSNMEKRIEKFSRKQ